VGFRVEGGAVARLVIDRAAKRNALTRAMWAALPGLLADLASDDEVKILLVTGEGASFSAGADIRELISGADPADPMATRRPRSRCCSTWSVRRPRSTCSSAVSC
jgi:enoyl-CoA hydratase/carnithine racemase